MNTPITVSIIEDERETSEMISALLGEAGLHCVASYPDAEAALRELPARKPNVALVDINLPGMSGIECVAHLRQAAPEVQVLMLTTYHDSDLIFNSLRAGARGYVLKKVPPAELIQAIEQVHAGGAPMSMQIARKVVDYFCQTARPVSEVEKLTEREQEVLSLLAQGCYYKEISERLGISLAAVKKRIHKIYEKLHVQSRTEATVKFLKRD